MNTLDHEYDEIDMFYEKVDEFYQFLTYIDENYEKITDKVDCRIDEDYFKIDTEDGYYEVQVDSTGMFLNCRHYFFEIGVSCTICISVDYEEIVDYIRSLVETTEEVNENQLNFFQKIPGLEFNEGINSNPG